MLKKNGRKIPLTSRRRPQTRTRKSLQHEENSVELAKTEKVGEENNIFKRQLLRSISNQCKTLSKR